MNVFGLVALPAIAAPRAHWANTSGDVHGTAIWVLLWLIGGHVAEVAYHHFLRRDGNLRRMVRAALRICGAGVVDYGSLTGHAFFVPDAASTWRSWSSVSALKSLGLLPRSGKILFSRTSINISSACI